MFYSDQFINRVFWFIHAQAIRILDIKVYGDDPSIIVSVQTSTLVININPLLYTRVIKEKQNKSLLGKWMLQ